MNRSSPNLLILSAMLLIALLSGCSGGGGGGGTTPSTTNPTTTTSGLPDLAIAGFTAPSAGLAGSSFSVTVSVTNLGTIPAAGAGVMILLSPTSDINADSVVLGMGVLMQQLDPGQSTSTSVNVSIPSYAANGNFYIGSNIQYADEVTKANNTTAQQFVVSGGTSCLADSYEADNNALEAKPLAFGIPQIHNHCNGTSDWLSFNAVEGSVYALSTSQPGYDADAIISIYDPSGTTELANSGLSLNPEARLSWIAPSSGTFYARVSPTMGLFRSAEQTGYTINLGDVRPDLVVTTIDGPFSGVSGGAVSLWASIKNQGFADLAGNYDVSYYLSADNVYDANDLLLGTQTITEGLAVGTSNSYVRHTVSLPAWTPGTYYLFAQVNPLGTANEYSVVNNLSIARAIDVISATCVDDAYESDNLYTQASPITIGAATQAHNHCLDWSDWVKFNATSGTKYAIRVTDVGGSSSAYLTLYSTDGTTVLAPASGTVQSLDWTAPTSGTYYLELSDSMGAGKDYTVSVNLALPDMTQNFYATYVNTSAVIAGSVIDVADTASNLGYSATGAFTIGIYLSTDNVITSSDTLIASREVSTIDPVGSWSTTNSSYYSAYVPSTVPPGNYYMGAVADPSNTVTEINEGNNASTPVAVTVIAPPCAVDQFEDDDVRASAKSISANNSQLRNACDDGIDWAAFTPVNDGVYLAGTGSFGPTLEIYESDGTTPVVLQDSYSYSLSSWNATAGHLYYFKNTAFQGTNSTYTLSVNQCVQDAYEEDDTMQSAKAITVGAAAQSRNLCEDGNDWSSFTAVAGTKYTITLTNVGSSADGRVELYEPGGITYIAAGSSAQGGKANVLSWTAPTNGTYYIHSTKNINAWGLNTDYTLQIQ